MPSRHCRNVELSLVGITRVGCVCHNYICLCGTRRGGNTTTDVTLNGRVLITCYVRRYVVSAAIAGWTQMYLPRFRVLAAQQGYVAAHRVLSQQRLWSKRSSFGGGTHWHWADTVNNRAWESVENRPFVFVARGQVRYYRSQVSM